MADNATGPVQMDTTERKVTSNHIERLSKVIPKAKYVSLVEELGGSAQEAQKVLSDHGGKDFNLLLLKTLAHLENTWSISRLEAALKGINAENYIVNILHTRCEGEVPQDLAEEISTKCPTPKYLKISLNLGKENAAANQILVKHLNNYQEAMMEIIMAWKARTGGPRVELEAHLINAGVYEAAKILYE